MAMVFEELDGTTRQQMLLAFDAEELSGNPYRGRGLSAAGLQGFAAAMRAAINSGTEVSLYQALNQRHYWDTDETYVRNGKQYSRAINHDQASERLSITEFNTWYVRGLAQRLINEGVAQCQVYRASAPKWEMADCAQHEGAIYDVAQVHAGHRARYWPAPGNATALSVPFGPGCHHTIRRYVPAHP